MQFFLAPNLWIVHNLYLGLSVLEFSWFKMSKEVNSCEVHLTPSINQMRIHFACHHLSHKYVHFIAKQCGEYAAIFVA